MQLLEITNDMRIDHDYSLEQLDYFTKGLVHLTHKLGTTINNYSCTKVVPVLGFKSEMFNTRINNF